MARSPEQVQEDISAQMDWDGRLDASRVTVQVDDAGRATLAGSVPNHGAATAALTDAWSVPGVVSVENRLAVEHPESLAVPADTELASNAVQLVSWDPEIDVDGLDISVDRGQITIAGSVDAAWKKEKVQTLLQNLTGVVAVNNELAVVPSASIADESIAREIVAALDRNALVDATGVTVSVEDGVVTLDGSVGDWLQRRTVYETALYTIGVRSVRNRLVVQADPESMARA